MSLKSNSFVAAAEHVCLQPVLEHRQRRGRRNISRLMGTKCICVCLQCFDAVENRVVGCWRGYLSGARCRLAYGPADATAAHCLLLQ